LGSTKCEEEEQERASEFGSHSNELVSPFAGKALLLLSLLALLLVDVSVGSLTVFMVVGVRFSLVLLVKGQ
jgi:hypothetical protein